MKVVVDRDVCELHGQCVLVVPEVFRLDERVELQYEEFPAVALCDRLKDAIEICPTGAIRIDTSS